MLGVPGGDNVALTGCSEPSPHSHMDRGSNLSTFTGQAVAGGLADMYASLAAAMADYMVLGMVEQTKIVSPSFVKLAPPIKLSLSSYQNSTSQQATCLALTCCCGLKIHGPPFNMN